MAAKKKAAAKKRAVPKKPAATKPAAARPKVASPKASPKTAAPAGGPWAAAFAPRAEGERRYWLVKSERSVFSFDDLLASAGQRTCWDGVRNYAARNFLRDGMKRGDLVFFYHSMDEPQSIVGVCEVVREGYPDHTATMRGHAHFDAESDPGAPTWFMVDLRAVERLPRAVTLPAIKARAELAGMALLRIGRLSVTPVTPSEWAVIRAMGAS
ncbi:MAG: EVE domain-containing protein [Gemmatimonadetes bacterium]|nr:EVE domain-containing protein [Gemmatimonadota bacterium]MBI3567250.1 EVE domain-containing protein [Gemmatimonadota bacterium]